MRMFFEHFLKLTLLDIVTMVLAIMSMEVQSLTPRPLPVLQGLRIPVQLSHMIKAPAVRITIVVVSVVDGV